MNVTRVVGVDPSWAKPMAVAYVAIASCEKAPALLDFRTVSDIKEMQSFLGTYHMIDTIFIEDQFMKVNYDTAKKLSWATGKVMGLAEMLGLEYDIVNVASWKSRMLGKQERVDGKLRYPITPIEVARKIWYLKETSPMTDDESCAALIAYYGALKLRGKL